MSTAPLLAVDRLSKHYSVDTGAWFGGRRTVKAADSVSFAIAEGETLGLVGESGSGKSTVARLILRLVPASGGTVCFRGEDVFALSKRKFRPYRRAMQMVFQDPIASLNPRYTVAQLLAEPMITHAPELSRTQRRARVADLMDKVGLDPGTAERYAHEFSGGQRQRIGIARALAVDARLIIADEPVSALDVSVQAQVLNLMADLRERHGLSYLFIAHDLAVVKHMSDRVAVMYCGRIVESAPRRDLYARPAHPYTKMLLASVPRPRVHPPAAADASTGEIPSLLNPPAGCAFHTRCRYKTPHCVDAAPELREIAAGHLAACHNV